MTFVSPFKGADSMIVRYFSHDGKHKLVYTCDHVEKAFKQYITGFSETMTSIGNCHAPGGPRDRLAAKFETPHIGKDNLYLKIWFSPTRSYRFTCVNPGALTKETDYRVVQDPRGVEVLRRQPRAEHDPVPEQKQAPPKTYEHIVVLMFDRTWSQVGGIGFGDMPYAAQLAQQCTYYADYRETNADQKSLPQYIRDPSGIDNPRAFTTTPAFADVPLLRRQHLPSGTRLGGTTRTYVKGHDRSLRRIDPSGERHRALLLRRQRPLVLHRRGPSAPPDQLPRSSQTFTMIIPTRCNNGHRLRLRPHTRRPHPALRQLTRGCRLTAGPGARLRPAHG